MSNFIKEKRLIQDFHSALDVRDSDPIEVMARYSQDNAIWRGYHPYGQLTAIEAGRRFWGDLRQSFSHLQRREDIFFAGENEIDHKASRWVVSMGHLMGLFDAPWLGLAPTGKMIFLRYCAFYCVNDDKITETAMYFDIPHVMMQAGLQPFPPQTAAHLVQPGPQTHDGILTTPQPRSETDKTLATINAMINDLGTWQLGIPLEDELRRTWHENMIWWGPAGIGATYTIPRYAKQHSGPFRAGFTDRSGTGHIARLAEGHYGGFFGWPNFIARPTGGFMGMPATGTPGEFRVIDIYRRSGDKLAENWVFIDLLHFWKTQGVDILARMQTVQDGYKKD